MTYLTGKGANIKMYTIGTNTYRKVFNLMLLASYRISLLLLGPVIGVGLLLPTGICITSQIHSFRLPTCLYPYLGT